MALANRKLAREGGDPLAEKHRAQGVPTFAEATARVVEQRQAGLAKSGARPRMDFELRAVRLPAYRAPSSERRVAPGGGSQSRVVWSTMTGFPHVHGPSFPIVSA